MLPQKVRTQSEEKGEIPVSELHSSDFGTKVKTDWNVIENQVRNTTEKRENFGFS